MAGLGEHLDAAASGEGSLVLVAGEAGAGKTSLVRSFAQSVPAGTLVMQGACDPLTTPRPLSPLYDFANQPEVGLDDLDLETNDNLAIFNEVLERLRFSARPVLTIIEDVHWADQATLDFVRFVGRRVADSKAVVVCTYRDDEVGPDHPLRPVLGQLIPLSSTHKYSIPSLSAQAVSVMTEGTGMDPIRLHALTGGNAFFVTEVIAGGQDLPTSVQDAVLARLSRLGSGARDVVQAVSIAPRELEVERALLLGNNVDDIDAAVSSGVILGDGKRLRFRHELARNAVEKSVPPAKRYSLHRRMLALLTEEDPPDHARLAHHAIQAESPQLTVEHAPAAAAEAERKGANKEAIAFYEATLAHAEMMDADTAAEVRVKLSFQLRIVDRQEDSRSEASAAVDHYRTTGAKHDLAVALDRLASAQWQLHDIPGSRASIDESIELLRDLGPSRDLAYALYHSSHLHMLARHGEPALREIAAAREIAVATGSADVVWMAEMMLGTIEIVVGDADKGARILQESKADAKRNDDLHAAAVALTMLGSGGGEARLYPEARAALEEGIEQGLAADQDYSVSYNRAWLARIAFEQGRWDEAVTHAELVDKTSQARTGIAMVTATGALGRVRVRRGDPRGRETLQRLLLTESENEIQHVWSPICGLAEYHWLNGGLAEMEPVLADGYRRALDTDSAWARGELGFWMWRAGLIDHPPDNAAVPFASQIMGDWESSAGAWREIGCPYEVALALADGSEEAKLEALAIFDSLGARPMADRLRALLRDEGATSIPRGPTKTTSSNPGGLTERQLEVMQLIADGLTNNEIADKLFVSKRTVEHHVSAIYGKLGVGTRAMAINAAAKIGAVEISQSH